MIDLLIDLHQQRRINEAASAAASANFKATTAKDAIADLERKADTLTLACQALWEIVRTRLNIDEEEILRMMRDIDARDGQVDGKISSTQVICERCQRTSNSRRRNCLYCGTLLPPRHAFEKG
jgi:hypothetical protein